MTLSSGAERHNTLSIPVSTKPSSRGAIQNLPLRVQTKASSTMVADVSMPQGLIDKKLKKAYLHFICAFDSSIGMLNSSRGLCPFYGEIEERVGIIGM